MRGHPIILIWLAAFTLAAPFDLAVAEQGDIIITREVQPRTATRPPLVPDPNPLVSNPGVMTRRATAELSDTDFASVSTGSSLKGGIDGSQTGAAQMNQMQPQHMPGVSSNHRAGGDGGGAQNAVSGQVNRSIQQGLRPLQQLGGQ